jgi:hypothetical protein
MLPHLFRTHICHSCVYVAGICARHEFKHTQPLHTCMRYGAHAASRIHAHRYQFLHTVPCDLMHIPSSQPLPQTIFTHVALSRQGCACSTGGEHRAAMPYKTRLPHTSNCRASSIRTNQRRGQAMLACGIRKVRTEKVIRGSLCSGSMSSSSVVGATQKLLITIVTNVHLKTPAGGKRSTCSFSDLDSKTASFPKHRGCSIATLVVCARTRRNQWSTKQRLCTSTSKRVAGE